MTRFSAIGSTPLVDSPARTWGTQWRRGGHETVDRPGTQGLDAGTDRRLRPGLDQFGHEQRYYHVTVRDGRVRQLEQVLPDGRSVELHPGKPEYFGVDGLFLTMAEEHAQLGTDRPFGQAKGSKAVLLFT